MHKKVRNQMNPSDLNKALIGMSEDQMLMANYLVGIGLIVAQFGISDGLKFFRWYMRTL